VSITPWLLFTPGKEPVPIVQEAGWAPGPVWTGAENLAPTGIRSPDHPACSQSLYGLRYPTHHISFGQFVFKVYLILLSLSSLIFLQGYLTRGDKGLPLSTFLACKHFHR
jgi:hypothetical protein